MLIISILLFGSVRQPLIIWLMVPMSINGVAIALLATDTAFGFMSLLGFLSLSGMLIKNAIVLLEEIDLLIGEGRDKYQAIVDASVSRMRPVMLAAITTILGMAPLLSDAFFRGMAVTIMGGLAFATVLTLIAAPVLYALFFRVRPAEERQDEGGTVSSGGCRSGQVTLDAVTHELERAAFEPPFVFLSNDIPTPTNTGPDG